MAYKDLIREGYPLVGLIDRSDGGSDVDIKLKELKKDIRVALEAAENNIQVGVILDNTVTTAKLANNAVTTAKLANGSVTIEKLDIGILQGGGLADDSVTTSKLADSAVTSAKIAGLAVTQAELGTGAVTTTKILDGAVTTGKIAPNAVTSTEIANDAVTTNKILNANITNAKLANSSVTVTAGNALTGGGVVALGAAVTLDVAVDDNTIEINTDALRVKDLGITSGKIASGAVLFAKAKAFVSTEQTGNGNPQNIAHGLGSTPNAVLITVTDTNGANGYVVTEGAHDGTNVVATVTSNIKYKVLAWV